MGIVAAEVVILGGSAAVFVSSRGAGGTAAVDFDLCRPAGSAAADDAGVATAAVGSSADVEATVTAGAAVGEAGSDARAGLFAAIADDAPHVISAAITLAIRRRSKSYSAQ